MDMKAYEKEVDANSALLSLDTQAVGDSVRRKEAPKRR